VTSGTREPFSFCEITESPKCLQILANCCWRNCRATKRLRSVSGLVHDSHIAAPKLFKDDELLAQPHKWL
jgi:hypothetical protein